MACQTREPTRRETGGTAKPWRMRGPSSPVPPAGSVPPIPRRRQPPPTHCGAPRRNGRDLIIATRPAHQPLPSLHQRQRRRDSFAPRRELLLSAVTKVAKSTGRNCVSALPQRAIPGSDLLRILAGIAFCHRCRIKGLCLRSSARRLPRPLAPATASVFRSYRHPPKPSP